MQKALSPEIKITESYRSRHTLNIALLFIVTKPILSESLSHYNINKLKP